MPPQTARQRSLQTVRATEARDVVLTKDNAHKPLPQEPFECYTAFKIYFQANGNMRLTDVAALAGVPASSVGNWHSEWRWDERVSMYESDLATGKAENMEQIMLLQTVVVANSFEDYSRLQSLWVNTITAMQEYIADAPSEVEWSDIAVAINRLTASRLQIDTLGRTATMLPLKYEPVNKQSERDQSRVSKERARQLSWGAEGGKLADKNNDNFEDDDG